MGVSFAFLAILFLSLTPVPKADQVQKRDCGQFELGADLHPTGELLSQRHVPSYMGDRFYLQTCRFF
jgi:hypothetical protein